MNRVFLIGNITYTPELSNLSGTPVCHFGLAVNRDYKSVGGERKADFFNITAWRTLGENVARYTKKGSMVCVTGRIETREVGTPEGKRIYYDIVADDVTFLSPKNADDVTDGKAQVYPFGDDDEDGDIPF